MQNCFTYAPLAGVCTGIQLSLDVPAQQGGYLRPHVGVGSGFVALDNRNPPSYNKDGVLHAATLREVVLGNGKTFSVFDTQKNDERSIICMVDLNRRPKGLKLKHDPTTINAWVAFEPEGNPRLLMVSAGHGRALVEFTADHQAVLVFDRDGMVYRLVRRAGRLESEHLVPAEIAKERVRILNQMVDGLGDVDPETDRRLHGIIGGATRLLGQALSYPEAVDVFVDFLVEFVGNGLTNHLRRQVKGMLDAVGHRSAVMFADGYGQTVVSLSDPRHIGGESRRVAEVKRRERSEQDRRLRQQMRGSSGSSGKGKRKGDKRV